MAGTNPSNLDAARALVAKLADPTFRDRLKTDPNGAVAEFTTLLKAHGAAVPTTLSADLQKAPPAASYDKLLKTLGTGPLDSMTVESITKLAPPPVFGIHCPNFP